ncbi:Vacuolar protein sorting-associated protein 8 [Agyrium rufum]|nr:Vacuolar protein sorting-associated protein 8 [Agyrium rufum]
MSSVPDEADPGPVEVSSRIEDGSQLIEDENGLEDIQGTENKELDAPLTWENGEEGAGLEVDDKEDTTAPANGVIEEDVDTLKGSTDGLEKKEDIPHKVEGPGSVDGSVLSTPDDTPSLQNSLLSSPGSQYQNIGRGLSPTPSLRPFGQRFSSRLSPSPLGTPRSGSPAFVNSHSRQSSYASYFPTQAEEVDTPENPWEVVSWRVLRKISGQAFSEIGKRNFGRPSCIAIYSAIALGTSRGMVLIFDQRQALKTIIGQGTKAIECGPVTAIAVSADQSTLATGHATGHIFTWEVSKHIKPVLHLIPPTISSLRDSESDGHVPGVAILHIGFLGVKNNALVSADDRGMAFSHQASRGLSILARSVRTTRILGRYPDWNSDPRPRKPSSVLAFSPLPLGASEHPSDSLGLTAMLTPYLLVVVSTLPVARTQFKANRPKEVTEHSAMSGALAWCPSRRKGDVPSPEESNVIKLAYSWSNVLTVMDVVVTHEQNGDKDKPPDVQFTPRKRWRADESIVSVQWLNSSVLAVMTITQQLVILEESSLHVTDSSDLIRKHIYHADLFSQQLNQLVESVEEEDFSMHGVVADAFYMSFKAYKGRLFLLGYNDVSVGALSNWADRLIALMEQGDFIKAIHLATSYYAGLTDKATIGLPIDDAERHSLVREKLTDMMSASLRLAFGRNPEAHTSRLSDAQLSELAEACIAACFSLDDLDFLFEDLYAWYSEASVQSILLELFEPKINEGLISTLPPTVVKDLIDYFMAHGWKVRLEDLLCRLDPTTMDIDQVTTLCRKHELYDAVLYVWAQALHDYTTIPNELIGSAIKQGTNKNEFDPLVKAFAFLSFVLTGRTYPTGGAMEDAESEQAKGDAYHFLFSNLPAAESRRLGHGDGPTSNFRFEELLRLDALSFMSVLDEAFEDTYLNESHDLSGGNLTNGASSSQRQFGLSLNRQYIVKMFLDVVAPPAYSPEEIVYVEMFIARNLPKFSQYILLPGNDTKRVLIDLCKYSDESNAEDCQLSVEYLLSVYHPPDLLSMIPIFEEARFFRVMKSIYRAEHQYSLLLETCFRDEQDPDAIYECVDYCLKAGSPLTEQQKQAVHNVLGAQASQMIAIDVRKTGVSIQRYAPDLHDQFLAVLANDEYAQYQYLQAAIDPRGSEVARTPQSNSSNHVLVEQYVRLLCDFEPQYVRAFVERLTPGNLQLEKVLPTLDTSGIVDAAVILLAREGQVTEANQRIISYLKTLEATFLGLVNGASNTPDPTNTQEAADSLLESIDKYARIGIWLCRSQAKPLSNNKRGKRGKKADQDRLSNEELIWLNLIDAVVLVTRDITAALESNQATMNGDVPDSRSPFSEPSKYMATLRSLVQDTFTALLNVTSTQQLGGQSSDSELSFLRILRAFLNRASRSSPSLSNLRSVLAIVFSAYSYEESLLDLANRLLDKDLFVQVEEVASMRQRGWRPLGQACEMCDQRIWGPGVGKAVWDAWALKNNVEQPGEAVDHSHIEVVRSGKEKGKSKKIDESPAAEEESTTESSSDSESEASRALVKRLQRGVIVFACRHIYHRQCLEEVQGATNVSGELAIPILVTLSEIVFFTEPPPPTNHVRFRNEAAATPSQQQQRQQDRQESKGDGDHGLGEPF